MEQLTWNPIDLFESGEKAICCHPISFYIIDTVDNISPPKRLGPSLRLRPGDEVYIVKGIKELYPNGILPTMNSNSVYPLGIDYIGRFRHAYGIISSCGLKHKDEEQNVGERMYSQLGFII